MDITKFVVSARDQAFLYGDHSSYQKQLAKKLLNCRKKLGISTKGRGKYTQRDTNVTASDVGKNHDYVHLLLLTSERAWANAMSMKQSHSADPKGITGRNRSHIVSRLEKAAKTADHLVEILSDTSVSNASSLDMLEAVAYASMIKGVARFEKQAWDECIKMYSIAHVIYNALITATKGDVYRDLLSETIDPSIRFAAYRLKTPRTVPVPVIARKAFPPASASNLASEVNKLDPSILRQDDGSAKRGPDNAPQTLIWRSREVRIEDAATATAWGAMQTAKAALSKKLEAAGRDLKEAAGAYDEILAASQEAVDATKQAIDELKGEGVAQGDARMQSLQITWTAVNFETASWRVGRNRVLMGEHDGAEDRPAPPSKRRARKMQKLREKGIEPKKVRDRSDRPGKRIARLREKVALYDLTLQNLESVKALPGVPADEQLTAQLDATVKYFTALRALAIARSHIIVENERNALVLINHAHEQSVAAQPVLAKSTASSDPHSRNIHVSSADAEFLQKLLADLLLRYRALVHLGDLKEAEAARARTLRKIVNIPLADNLNHYPADGVDLDNIVDLNPKLELIPAKPIFLDIAYNYLEYPQVGKQPAQAKGPAASGSSSDAKPAQQPQKRGWFGFGRS